MAASEVARRMAGVNAAIPVCELLLEELGKLGDDPQTLGGFWGRFRSLLKEHGQLPDPPGKPTPMTDQEARAFELEPWPFHGEHRNLGHTMGHVMAHDKRSIHWALGLDFHKRLDRYVRNPAIARELGLHED